ncbi:response regulator [Flavilitoribacter nigricans]|uniref:Response regulator n=1 Tax=Flavilitoribacter nigricans (strain ATCC 23147 / DSM 23189 / NBRC 102662 / NCIMB 1420 / SS-2) TaxID=1122177 RepID=A0A2D0MXY3_FLAN2|nr:response regulator [Flavilitoribacter nigricans]PHN00986.1 response regulator [Flavilitoribacter nigricans DSM 23189 = NBRC 102662]
MEKKHILIVDDDPDILNVMTNTLQLNQSYHVIGFSNGKEVLNYIDQHPLEIPDLFVLDIWLPDIDGDEIAQLLRKNEDTRNRFIILISAVIDAKTVAEEVGADDYLSKPFLIEELEHKVDQLIRA